MKNLSDKRLNLVHDRRMKSMMDINYLNTPVLSDVEGTGQPGHRQDAGLA